MFNLANKRSFLNWGKIVDALAQSQVHLPEISDHQISLFR